MSRKDDIEVVLAVADGLLQKIQEEYDRSLEDQNIDPQLPVHIKNYLENLRSALDYIASEIAENILSLESSHRAYFPVACVNDKDFIAHMNRNMPGLDKTNSQLYDTLKAVQGYQAAGCKALARLSKLVNGNKHNQLSPQTRKEQKGLDIQFPGGATISLPPGSSISGGGTITSGGGYVSPAGSTISGDSPANVGGGGVSQTVTRWVTFTFDETGDNVISILRSCRDDVNRIVDEVKPFLF